MPWEQIWTKQFVPSFRCPVFVKSSIRVGTATPDFYAKVSHFMVPKSTRQIFTYEEKKNHHT